jgi:hypothetical protein
MIASPGVSRPCLLQVAGDLHMGGRASAESAQPSAFGGASAPDAGPDGVRDSQSDGTLIESDLEVGCVGAARSTWSLSCANPTWSILLQRGWSFEW